MPESKQSQLEELRLETKIVGLTRVKEALELDQWSDVAKLGKDAYAAIVKEEVSVKAERAIQLQMLSTLGNHSAVEKILGADPQLQAVLAPEKKLPAPARKKT